MPDLHDLLDRGVPTEPTAPDAEALLRRGLRRRRTKRTAAGAAAVVVLLAGVTSVVGIVSRPDLPVIGEGPGDASAELSWVPVAESPLTPRESPRSATDGTRVVLWGGEAEPAAFESGSTHRDDGAVWDARTDRWTGLPPAPFSPRLGAHPRIAGATVVVFGGRPESSLPGATTAVSTPLMDGAVHDLDTGTWTRIPPAPLTARTPAAISWDGTELLVWGGETDQASPRADGARWTAATGWTRMGEFPLTARSGAAIAWDDDRLVVWGGGTDLDPPAGRQEQLVADGAVYDRATDRWTVLPTAPLSARWFSYGDAQPTARLDGDRVLIAGGATTQPLEQFRDGAWLDLAAGTWTPITSAPADARFVVTDAAGAVAVDDADETGGTVWTHDEAADRWVRAEVGQRPSEELPAAAWGRALWSRVSAPEADGAWRPVDVVRPGRDTVAPALDPGRRVSHIDFSAVVPVDGGVLLWGGMRLTPSGDGFTGDGWTADGWFLRVP
ncbi:MAG: hypothetical protein ACLGIR_08145 [Actinomycetes bacterium]